MGVIHGIKRGDGGSSAGLPNAWGLVIESNADGTRPGNAWGTVVTPGLNTFGAYTQILAATSGATYLCRIWLDSFTVLTTARDALVTIGIDLAGGASFTDFIVDLAASCASTYGIGGGFLYEFPVYIPAGASLGAKASVNAATAGTGRVSMVLFGAPTRSDLIKYGTLVRTFGSTPASSSGTAITEGTVSEGAWTQVGSALVETLWAWEFGICFNNLTMANTVHHVDIAVGDAGTKRVVLFNGIAAQTTAEALSRPTSSVSVGAGNSGELVYMRLQSGPNISPAGASVIAYAVGG